MLRSFGALLAIATILSGCGNVQDQLTGRYGPNPIPTGASVGLAAQRQSEVVIALAKGANFGSLPTTREEWYKVINVGFNVVDDACMTYIDDLWILERRKARTDSLISATGAAVAGIVAANANPSAATLGILAQAFGLASAYNTAISDSFLYTQNAATIKKLVRKTTEAYRTDLARKVPAETEITYPIGSPEATYHHMREYLSLCLPPTIQAQIEDLVANAKATPENSPTDAAITQTKSVVTESAQTIVPRIRVPTATGSSVSSIVVR